MDCWVSSTWHSERKEIAQRWDNKEKPHVCPNKRREFQVYFFHFLLSLFSIPWCSWLNLGTQRSSVALKPKISFATSKLTEEILIIHLRDNDSNRSKEMDIVRSGWCCTYFEWISFHIFIFCNCINEYNEFRSCLLNTPIVPRFSHIFSLILLL